MRSEYHGDGVVGFCVSGVGRIVGTECRRSGQRRKFFVDIYLGRSLDCSCVA